MRLGSTPSLMPILARISAEPQLEAKGIKVDRRPSGSVAVDPGHSLVVRLSLIRA
jgi:hypothetical protein